MQLRSPTVQGSESLLESKSRFCWISAAPLSADCDFVCRFSPDATPASLVCGQLGHRPAGLLVTCLSHPIIPALLSPAEPSAPCMSPLPAPRAGDNLIQRDRDPKSRAK